MKTFILTVCLLFPGASEDTCVAARYDTLQDCKKAGQEMMSTVVSPPVSASGLTTWECEDEDLLAEGYP